MSAVEIDSLSKETQKELLKYLIDFVTPNKQQKFNEILSLRTRHLTILLEDIYQPHNASACIRSSECFGIQDIHIIEDKYTYEINPQVLKGSAKWISMNRYTSTAQAIQNLKSNGYKIVATSPHQGSIPLEHLPITEKLAIAFGTELKGVSKELLDAADYKVYIPMYGFTESFNISVSVAIILQYLTEKLRLNHPKVWRISQEEREYLMLEWAIKAVTRVDIHINKFFNQKNMH